LLRFFSSYLGADRVSANLLGALKLLCFARVGAYKVCAAAAEYGESGRSVGNSSKALDHFPEPNLEPGLLPFVHIVQNGGATLLRAVVHNLAGALRYTNHSKRDFTARQRRQAVFAITLEERRPKTQVRNKPCS
jgi:hypothetical protein